MNKMKPSKKIAICGILTALSLITMFLTAIIPIATYATPAVCGVYLIVVVIEIGRKQALIMYLAVSLLSIFITPDRQAVLLYILLFGYYPVLKSIVEEKYKRVKRVVIKGAVTLVSIIAIIATSILINGIEVFKEFPLYIYIIGFIICLITFWAYDYCLTLIVDGYIKVFKKKYLNRFFK